jgi:hypothetical protein
MPLIRIIREAKTDQADQAGNVNQCTAPSKINALRLQNYTQINSSDRNAPLSLVMPQFPGNLSTKR